jgi:hypothetical protein
MLRFKSVLNLSPGFCLLICFLGVTAPLPAQQKTDFAAHPLFKLLIGEWKSEGVLKNAEGKEIKIVEEWTGKASAAGEFVMEGHRVVDQDKQEYIWTFSHNAATGLYEATHNVKSNEGDIKRFEASVSDVDLTMELRLVGDGASSIVVRDSFPGPDRDTLESEVTLTGSGGETNLSGKIIHKRVKKP